MPLMKIDIPGRSKKIRAWYSVPTPDLYFILSYLKPGVDFNLHADHVDYAFPLQNEDKMPTEAEVLAVVEEEKEERAKRELSEYTDAKALRYGATMIDPNSATNEPIADPAAGIDEIRQQQGKARAKMHWGKRNGSDGDSSTPGSKARNSAAQTLEEILADEVVAIQIDIEAGTVTTEAQVDARIEAIDLTY